MNQLIVVRGSGRVIKTHTTGMKWHSHSVRPTSQRCWNSEFQIAQSQNSRCLFPIRRADPARGYFDLTADPVCRSPETGATCDVIGDRATSRCPSGILPAQCRPCSAGHRRPENRLWALAVPGAVLVSRGSPPNTNTCASQPWLGEPRLVSVLFQLRVGYISALRTSGLFLTPIRTFYELGCNIRHITFCNFLYISMSRLSLFSITVHCANIF